MAVMRYDANGHEMPNTGPVIALTAGALGTSAIGTISPTSRAGATTTIVTNVAGEGMCMDRAGTFQIKVSGGATSSGVLVVVMFAVAYANVPTAVLANIGNEANPSIAVACGISGITTAGFNINGPALVNNQTYDCCYLVVAAV